MNRMFKTLIIGVGVLTLPLLMSMDKQGELSSYTPRDTYEFQISGQIFDKQSGVSISNANVKVEHKHVELSSSPSDDDGKYELKFESTIDYKPDQLNFIVTRDGYRDKRVSNVPVMSGAPSIVNFKLERKPVQVKRDPHAQRWETIEYLKEVNRYGY